MENHVSFKLPPSAKNVIEKAIDDIYKSLPEMVNLTNEERHTLPKMGDKTGTFVLKCQEYAKLNPSIVPDYLDMDEFDIDIEAVETISHIIKPLRQLLEMLDDTAMLSGSEAYEAALVFYHSVKGAAKADLPGTKTIFEDLQKHFPRKKKNEEEPSEDKNEETPDSTNV